MIFKYKVMSGAYSPATDPCSHWRILIQLNQGAPSLRGWLLEEGVYNTYFDAVSEGKIICGMAEQIAETIFDIGQTYTIPIIV